MPPITPQSSRTSLITGTVVSIIAAVTAIIFAIYFYVDANRTRDEQAQLVKKYNNVVPEAALAGSDITDLKNRAGADDAAQLQINPSMSAMDIALRERDILAERIAGAGSNFDRALSASNAAAASANEKAKAAGVPAVTNINLAGSVDALANAVQTRQNEIASLTSQLDAAKKQVADTTAQMAANSKALDEHLAQVRGQAEQATGAAT